LLILKTLTRRIALPAVLFLVWTPAAHAWSWPLQGPVLKPFTYDEAHPYASGQHRGIDIGAAAAGDSVVAPAAGSVSFAGTVPTNGKSVTIETADGYSVTLTHLGSLLVAKGAAVAEGDEVGTVGPSGTPEVDAPYVHLGIRLAADPDGYVDPLGLLPAAPADDPPTDGAAPVPQPGASGGSAASPPAAEPAPPAPEAAPVATTRGSTATPGQSQAPHRATERAQEPRAETSQRPASHHARTERRGQHRVPTQHRRPSPSARPVVEPSARREPTGLDAGQEPQPSVPVPDLLPGARPASPVPLLCNGVAALVAVAAAFAAARRRRQQHDGAEVLHLRRQAFERHERRAA
jgi:hypothetical protein